MPTADEDIVEHRRSQALALRLRGFSVREIGKELGIGKSTAAEDVRAAMAGTLRRTAEELDAERELELHRIDHALKVVARILDGATDDEALALAAADSDKTPEDLLADAEELKLKAIDRQVKLQEQRAKLLGLYAATKQEHSGPEGAPIAIDDRRSLLERLAGLVASKPADGAPGADPSEPDGGGK